MSDSGSSISMAPTAIGIRLNAAAASQISPSRTGRIASLTIALMRCRYLATPCAE